MSRGIPQSVKNAFQDDGFYLATLIEMYRAGTRIAITDHQTPLTYASQQYAPSEYILEVGSTSESQELRINDMTLTLSGVGQDYIASFLNNSNFSADIVRIYRAVLNPDTDQVIGAFVAFDGRISEYAISESESDSTVELTIASHWADFEKYNGRKTNQNSQQIHFPNDLGFQYASKIVKDLRWGRKG